MKKIIILVVLYLLAILALQAQKPQPVYGFARVHQSITWYKEQSAAWKKACDRDPKDANAWYNYYRATKNLIHCDTLDLRPRKEKWESLKKIIETMASYIADTYEYNYCKWDSEGNNFAFLAYLKRADELSDGKTLHFDYMINWGEIEHNLERRNTYCKKMYEAGDISAGLMFYNHNVVAGTRPNAILFTGGDNDTYPVWVLQSQGIRQDITVLNMHLLHIDTYREKMFRDLGIEDWDMDYLLSVKDPSRWAEKRFQDEVIKKVAANKKNYPVYVSVTLASCDAYIKPVEDNLYLTGLVYEYSKDPVDNIAVMKRNFEQNYALDYIDKSFFNEISPERVKSVNGNYIVPMLKLYAHYRMSGDNQKAEWIRHKILFISKGNPDEEDIKKHLAKN